MSPPLLSRSLDPALGIFTGLLAYYLHERNPRTAVASDERLSELIKWKWRREREETTDIAHIDQKP